MVQCCLASKYCELVCLCSARPPVVSVAAVGAALFRVCIERKGAPQQPGGDCLVWSWAAGAGCLVRRRNLFPVEEIEIDHSLVGGGRAKQSTGRAGDKANAKKERHLSKTKIACIVPTVNNILYN